MKNCSTAFGYYTNAYGPHSLVSGWNNTSTETAIDSVVFGNGNTISGCRSMTIGESNNITGNNSVAFGKGLIVSQDNCTVLGQYNKDDKSNLFQIGAGTEDSPKTAFGITRAMTGHISGVCDLDSLEINSYLQLNNHVQLNGYDMYAVNNFSANTISASENISTKYVNISEDGYLACGWISYGYSDGTVVNLSIKDIATKDDINTILSTILEGEY